MYIIAADQNNMEIKILPGEVWYGLASDEGTKMPLDADSDYRFDMQPAHTGNQYSPLLVSNKGRYIWGDDGYNTTVSGGVITVTSKLAQPELHEGYGSLRGAYLAAAKAHFPTDGVLPPEEFFSKPQYNTWIEFIYDQNQAGILEYASTLVKNNMPRGILMIDDLWSNYYGKWDFDRYKFPDPKGMMDKLHEWGFKVMVWICPFVSLDSIEYRDLSKKGAFVRSPDGNVRAVRWWNGISAVLDLSNPVDAAWIRERCRFLCDTYGVDGFKLDAGDAIYYRDDDKNYGNVTPNEQCELWAKLGLEFPYNEYRACYKCAGRPLVQRLCDKSHSWTNHGINTLVPNMLAQGILGYAYGCPDMVGGGSYTDFLPGSRELDEELFVRYCAAATLMPMIQFSAAPWRVLDSKHYGCILKLLKLREKFLPEILRLVRESAETGEPVVRYMEYVFPNSGFERVTDQFMLGDDILVAPVTVQGATGREVILPDGVWSKYSLNESDSELYTGGKTVWVDAALDCLPVFVRKCD